MVGATTRPLPILIKGSLLADIFKNTIRIGGAHFKDLSQLSVTITNCGVLFFVESVPFLKWYNVEHFPNNEPDMQMNLNDDGFQDPEVVLTHCPRKSAPVF